MKLERPKKIGAPSVNWVSPPKVKAKGETPMIVEITVPEVFIFFKRIQKQDNFFAMIQRVVIFDAAKSPTPKSQWNMEL